MYLATRTRRTRFARAISLTTNGWIVSVVLAGALSGCAAFGDVKATGAAPPARPAVAAGNSAADLRIAESALAAGDTALAQSLYQKMLKANPESETALLGLADTAYATGDVARAGVLYARVQAQRPDNSSAQLGLARVALRERRLEEAESRYRKLIAAEPDSAVAAEGLGTVLDLQGRHVEAQAVYRAALQRHPEVHGLKVNLGLSFILCGKPREGANVLLDIAGLPGAPPQARQNLALAYGLLGNDEAARRILVAESLPPDSVEDGLEFYRRLRTRLGNAPGTATGAVAIAPIPMTLAAPSQSLR